MRTAAGRVRRTLVSLSVSFSILMVVALLPTAATAQTGALTVVSSGPNQELDSLAQANEIRVVFSEPMVVLGRIPQPVQAPFFTIKPAVRGTFRWSGTTILIFTPATPEKLPFATRYEVTIAASAKAISGRTLGKPHTFAFTTPTAKLHSTNWYRKNGRFDAPLVIGLRFNQSVRPADIAAHATLRFESHAWTPPTIAADAQARLKQIDPQAVTRFDARVAATKRAAAATTPVTFQIAKTWDITHLPAGPDLVVLETTSPVPPESWVRVELDGKLPSIAGVQTPGSMQTYTVKVGPAFFITGFTCRTECNPDSYNALHFSQPITLQDLRARMSLTDITNAARATDVKPTGSLPQRTFVQDDPTHATLEDLGYAAQPPARTYAVRVDPTLQSIDGQTLGYTWLGIVENWHERAFTSFGDGHGVWEADGGPLLPFYARNFMTVTQWVAPLTRDTLMPTILDLQPRWFRDAPDGPGVERKLAVKPDAVQSFGLNLSGALNAAGRGIVWAAVKDGDPIAKARTVSAPPYDVRATVVQVTNLGITVKDSPLNTLVFVTRLDNGEPVDAATVSIIDKQNRTFWTGKTNADGLVLAPNTRLRDPDRTWEFAFIVTAEKDGDIAYVGSDWQEGIRPWEFSNYTDLHQADPILRGSLFSDRGVYKLGEEVHVKAVLRHDTPTGIRLLDPNTPIEVTLRDSQNREIDKRILTTNAWSSAEWVVRLPETGSLGTYNLSAIVKPRAGKDTTNKAPAGQPAVRNVSARDVDAQSDEGSEDGESSGGGLTTVYGSFLVAAYRRPEFRVDATLTGAPGMAGATLEGDVTGRYLFGAAMSGRTVRWNVTRTPSYAPVDQIRKQFTDERFEFIDWGSSATTETVESQENELGTKGEFDLQVETPKDLGRPYVYTLEGEVEDVSRQRIAGRASFFVHPAPWYIGLLRPSSFVDEKTGLSTAIVTVAPDGTIVPGVSVDLKLVQRQWHSVRRAEGNGFYTWDWTETETEIGQWTITSAAQPVPLSATTKGGGAFTLIATAHDAEGRSTTTRMAFYGVGEGYTAWQRYDHQRIDLLPERTTYKPGDTARIMIQSPWERATALVTTEREGVRSQRRFVLTSTQQTIDVPITEADIPNVYVSVLLVKGRTTITAKEGDTSSTPTVDDTTGNGAADASDPGKPAFRLGYTQLQVEDATKKLAVRVKANKEEFRPAGTAKVEVEVVDAQGKPSQSEVTLWAVDYGVLSLTSFKTPEVLKSVYVQKALQVFTEDNRQRVVSRRVLTPKGASEGGGGGEDSGVSSIRKDFRVLAFWLGSVVTDSSGRAKTTVTLPESLTTYRIMAVSGDRLSRFGSGESEIRINKPVLLRAAFPRFLAVGDTAYFGSVITNQLKEAGAATVTIKSLDPGVLELRGEAQQRVQVNAGGSTEVRFHAAGKSVGRARVQMTVRLRGESDAFEEIVPVEILSSPETVTAYGEAKPDAHEALNVPTNVVPGVGGLHLELSSTAMVGLGEGARYLVEYPYGCAEQRGSRALALMLTADLGNAFALPGVPANELRPRVQKTLKELEEYQCPSGGFAYWPNDCISTSPYLTAYLLHVFQVADSLKYTVDADMKERAYTYLERELAQKPDVNEGWWPAYTAWQAFAVKVLVEGGRQQDSNITRLYGYLDRMPVFGMAYLYDALTAKGEKGERVDAVRQRILNAVLPEGGSAHVEELSDPYLLWFWNSNIRSTAIVLGSLVRNSNDDTHIRSFVRWLMTVRTKGRWGNTQENAIAMEALVAYYKKYESEVPDFTGIVTVGPSEPSTTAAAATTSDARKGPKEPVTRASNELAREKFTGRSTTAVVRDVPMKELSARVPAGVTTNLDFTKNGTGTLFYVARLRYAVDALVQEGMDNGFRIERRYARVGENGRAEEPTTTFKAGDLIQITLAFDLTKERRFVAVTDPLPAGLEPIESWFNTTASALANRQDREDAEHADADGNDAGDNDGDGDADHEDSLMGGWANWWRRGGFDHVERHDDRVLLFATRLSEGHHTFSYIVRATTAGTFRTAPAHVEEMYEPEVFGRTATSTIEVQR